MKNLDKPHPFKISVVNNSIFVNGGRVYCYYNPLNFQNVRWDAKKSFLPQQPLPVSDELQKEEGIKISENGIPIPQKTEGINIYLLASFLPPKRWIPSAYYIPIIQRAWIALLCAKKNEENPESVDLTIIGETQNFSSQNIRLRPVDQGYGFRDVSENSDMYRPYNEKSNAWNLGILGQVQKTENSWTIVQSIKNHFPITYFRDAFDYSTANTELYNVNNTDVLDVIEWKAKYSEAQRIYAELNSFLMSDFFYSPNAIRIGHLNYKPTSLAFSSFPEFKFPLTSVDVGENSYQRNAGIF